MICFVTPAEMNGGILQFSVMTALTAQKITESVLFVPDTVEDKYLCDLNGKFQKYKKIKTVNTYDKGIVALADEIAGKNPQKVIFLEDSVLMQQLSLILRKKGIYTAMVVHDAVKHPSNKLTPRQRAVEFLRGYFTKKTLKSANAIIFLSENTKNIFKSRYYNMKSNIALMRLGAHVPNVDEIKPEEINDDETFVLFFGRIDKYKGIENLCRAYSAMSETAQENLKLVVAGKGTLTDAENELIENNVNIIKINRFILDEEMIWLVNHSLGIVLPYIEASQSGVLPIAYHYCKPVVVSNLDGLTENIENGKTGAVFKSIEELKLTLELLALKKEEAFSREEIKSYYEENYNWNDNLKKLLEQLK